MIERTQEEQKQTIIFNCIKKNIDFMIKMIFWECFLAEATFLQR